MRVRPWSSMRQQDEIFEVEPPLFERDPEHHIVCDENGDPIFSWPRPTIFDPMQYPSMPRRLFTSRFKRIDVITPAAALVFDHLLTLIPYGRLEPYFDDTTKLPIYTNAMRSFCKAKVATRGNVTMAFRYEQLSALTGGYSKQTIKDALRLLTDLGIIARRTVDRSTQTKHTRSSGRPKELLKYEVNSRYAWHGRSDHGLACPVLPDTEPRHSETSNGNRSRQHRGLT